MAARLEFADAARQGFGWVGSVAVETGVGLGWRDPEVLADDLYSGTAGVLFACAEATAAGLDPAQVGSGACARLRHLAGSGANPPTLPDDSLFSGWAGVTVALQAWSRATGDPAASDAAAQVRAQIAARLLSTPADPERYLDIIAGDAGILLALLAATSSENLALQAAHALADRLAAAAEPTPDGPQWRYKAGWPALMPGFSHGTAGAAYALAAAGRILRRADLVDIATAGARTLLAIGDHPGGWAVPLTIPLRPGRPTVNYGWCHGPAGAARLFMLLDAIDPQPTWRHAIEACLLALRDSRLPARLYPGYWDNLARCCGTAGVGQLLLDLYQATGDPALLAWSATLATDITARALPVPGGVTWSNTEHTKTPPDLPPEPGLMGSLRDGSACHHGIQGGEDGRQ